MVGFGTRGEVKVQAVTAGADTTTFESDVTRIFKWALDQEAKIRENVEVNLEQAVIFLVRWVQAQEEQSRQKVEMLEKDANSVFNYANKQTIETYMDLERLQDYTRSSLSVIGRAISAFNTLFKADIETKWLSLGLTAQTALREAWVMMQHALTTPWGWGMVPAISMLILSWAEFMAFMVRTQDQIEASSSRTKNTAFEEMIGTIQ